MQTIFISGPNGYQIPLRLCAPDAARRAVLIVHGFGSSKRSTTAVRLAQALAELDVASCALDLPAHGESPVDGRFLTVDNCLRDMAAAEQYLCEHAPQAQPAYFGSSFGAYLTALYLARGEHRQHRAVLRCAALTMYQLLSADISNDPELSRQMSQQGAALLLEAERPLLLTPQLLDSLQANDPFAQCRPPLARLLLIHGTADEEAPLQQAQKFARQMQAKMIEIKDAGHRFEGPGQMERVLKAAGDFFTAADI